MKATLLTPAVAAATFTLLSGNPCFAAPFSTDNAGQVSTTVVHKDGTYTTTQRDGNSGSLVRKTKRKNGTLVMRSEFSLDEFGRERKGRVYDGLGNLLFISEFVYDRDTLVEERVYNARGQIVRRLLYTAKVKGLDGRMKPAVMSYQSGRPIGDLVALDDPKVFSTTSTHAHSAGSAPPEVVRSSDGSSVRMSGGSVRYPSSRSGTTRSRSSTRSEPRRRLRIFNRNR